MIPKKSRVEVQSMEAGPHFQTPRDFEQADKKMYGYVYVLSVFAYANVNQCIHLHLHVYVYVYVGVIPTPFCASIRFRIWGLRFCMQRVKISPKDSGQRSLRFQDGLWLRSEDIRPGPAREPSKALYLHDVVYNPHMNSSVNS